MFATLAGGYPAFESPTQLLPGPEVDALVREILGEQTQAGLGLLTDGSLRWPDPVAAIGAALWDGGRGPAGAGPGTFRWRGAITVAAWAFAAEAAGDLPVKQCLPGPYTLGRRLVRDDRRRAAETLRLADALAREVEALGQAGCPFIQIDEDDATQIGADEPERVLFRAAHEHLLAGVSTPGSGANASNPDEVGALQAVARPHMSLAITGGNADAAGPETIFAPAYDSHFFDLLAGPENWRLITRAPAERGIVLGVVEARSAERDFPEVLVWAIGYAASTGGRGEGRIGIAPSGSLAGLPRSIARRKIELLGHVAGLVERRNAEPIAASLDPRAVDIRSAALGRWTPPERHSEG